MSASSEPKTIFGVVLHDVSRLGKIVAILTKFGFGSVLQRIGLSKQKGSQDLGELARTPQKTAQRLCEAINELGTTYIKFGQVLSTRSDLLPKAYIDELQKLQDHVQPMEFSLLQSIVHESIGPIEEHFSYIDPTPTGSASIAQVHRATTLDGRELVLKVQRPKLMPLIRADIDILLLFARGLSALFEEFDYFNLPQMVQEFEQSLIEELDFTNELHNIQYFENRFKDNPQLVFPTPDIELSRPNILVMRYIQGEKITSLTPSTDLAKTTAQDLIKFAFEMVFNDGIFHADPHPGNLLITPDHKIALLDFGLVGSFTPAQRTLMTSIVISLFLSNTEMIARCLVQLGTPTRRVILRDLEDDIRILLQKHLKATLAELDAEAFVYDFLHAGQKFGVRIPTEFTTAVRALIHIEALVIYLHPAINIPDTLAMMAKKLIADKRSPRLLTRAALQSSLSNANLLQSLPSNLAQILLDLNQDGLPVKLHTQTLTPLLAPLHSLASKISITLMLAALLMVSQNWQNPIFHTILCVAGVAWLALLILSHLRHRPQSTRRSLTRLLQSRKRR